MRRQWMTGCLVLALGLASIEPALAIPGLRGGGGGGGFHGGHSRGHSRGGHGGSRGGGVHFATYKAAKGVHGRGGHGMHQRHSKDDPFAGSF